MINIKFDNLIIQYLDNNCFAVTYGLKIIVENIASERLDLILSTSDYL